MHSPPAIESKPCLWNPVVAAIGSLVFSPAFGSFLHAENAKRLGRLAEVKINQRWFWGMIIWFVVDPFFPSLAFIFPFFDVFLTFALPIIWYLTTGRKQVEVVTQLGSSSYDRRPWLIPFVIGVLGSLLVGAFHAGLRILGGFLGWSPY